MIPLFKVHYPKGIGYQIERVFDDGIVTEGKYSDEFEKQFSAYIGNPNTRLLNSCTSALTLAAYIVGCKEGDEVITTPMTCMATNEPFFHTGTKLVFADIDPRTGCIDPNDVAKKINGKTKAIIGMHWGGQPFEIDDINKIAQEYGIRVVEDAAQALGAKYNGKMIGGNTNLVCFSFQAIKHLTTVDGGALSCGSFDEAERIRFIRWFGLDRQYKGSKWEQDINECGYKMHMNNVAALIGIEQMKYIESIVSRHVNNGKFFDKNISNGKIKKLERPSKCDSSYWIYSLLVDNKEDFKKYMEHNGICSDVVHVRNDKYSVFGKFRSGTLRGVDEFNSKLMNIPVGWWLSQDDLNRIVSVVNQY